MYYNPNLGHKMSSEMLAINNLTNFGTRFIYIEILIKFKKKNNKIVYIKIKLTYACFMRNDYMHQD